MKRLLISASVCIVILLLGFWGWQSWRAAAAKGKLASDLQEVSRLLEQDQPAEARRLVIKNLANAKHQGVADQWAPLDVATCLVVGDFSRLLWMFEHGEPALAKNNDANLVVGRLLLDGKRHDDLKKLRQTSSQDPAFQAAWLFLDVDTLLALGQREQAVQLLASSTLAGAEDSVRWERLAILSATQDPRQAWRHLDAAFHADPRNAAVRTFRGNIWEAANQPLRARVEYVAAHLAEPSDPLHRNQLAKFYCRQGSYSLALETWISGLEKGGTIAEWIEFQFWTRVALPSTVDASGFPPPNGANLPLVTLLAELPPGRFWDEEAHDRINRQLTAERPPLIAWLQVLERLRLGQEDQAASLLRAIEGEDPDFIALRDRLSAVLHFRKERHWKPIPDGPAAANANHSLWASLQAARSESDLAPELQELLLGKNAFSACCLASGWSEAALTLLHAPLAPTKLEWWPYGLIQVLRSNRGPADALRCAESTQSRPECVELLIAELKLGLDDLPAALPILERLARESTDVGRRAGWLLAEAWLASGEEGKAEQVVRGTALRNEALGQELLAKIHVARNELAEAARIYAELGDSSPQGMAFRAQQAFAAKDFDVAETLTRQLAESMPDQLDLARNLAAISAARPPATAAEATTSEATRP